MQLNSSLLWQETQHILWLSQNNIFFEDKNNYDILIHTLNDHNHLYYIENNPIISDGEYDTLFSLLKEFESLHPEYINDQSPTQILSEQYNIQGSFQKSNHESSILSLQNTYNTEDIQERYDSISGMINKKANESDQYSRILESTELLFSVEPKYDGLAIVITYEKWKLVRAVTRWDGYTGDDVTANIKTIKNLPLTIQETKKIIVRWEVMMPKSVWQNINVTREENNEEPFSNTRNAAAWSLKLLDTNEVAKRWLICYIYDILQWPQDSIIFFENLNDLTNQQQGYTLEQTITLITDETLKKKLLSADVDFDGLVIKLLHPLLRELLWDTNHHPRRAIAYKFPTQQIATQIISIERQVWRTGILTPVANLTPVTLSGVTISRVSLHNIDFITRRWIHISDRVWLQRSGEVIPYIVWVITQRRDGSEKAINPETVFCPECKTKASIITNIVGTKKSPITTTQLICPNTECPGILREKLKHFVSKNAMNIASLGDATLDVLVDQKILQSLSDLYSLTDSEVIFLLKRFPGIGEKKVDILIEEINGSKKNPLWRFLNGLGISGIGIKLAKEIEKHLWYRPVQAHTLEQIFSIITNPDFLNSIYGVGEKLIQEIQTWIKNPHNKILLENFSSYHLLPTTSETREVWAKNKKTICITGTFPLPRSELEFYITQSGYQFSPTLTKNTDYLLIWEHAGSKKDKAWPNTKVLDNIQEIYSLLHISSPLFTTKEEEKSSPSWGAMQSLFG